MAKPEPLKVWLYGHHVADLTARHPWELYCKYTQEALELYPHHIPLLSCSLPLQPTASNASIFASGLLPEGQHRYSLAAAIGVPATDTYALLKRFGKDVAGAMVISAEELQPRQAGVLPYTPQSLEEEIIGLPAHPLGIHDDSELSIAGLQDKLLLVDLGQGRWGRPIHGNPSTHILKLDDRTHPGLVNAEAECLLIARLAGLTDIQAHVQIIADIPCLIVSRYDRRTTPEGTIERLQQEDLCQALARDPDAARGRGKYQDAGGPSWRELATLFDKYSPVPNLQFDRMVAAITFTIAIGNADGHGKNIALLHSTPETIQLAPLYDTVPTVLWPQLRDTAAMSVNSRWPLHSITIEDIGEEATLWSHDKTRARRIALETAEKLRIAAHSLGTDSRVAQLVVQRTEKLLKGLEL